MRHVRDHFRGTSRSFLVNHSRQANIPIQAAHDTLFYSERCSRCMLAEWSPRLARDGFTLLEWSRMELPIQILCLPLVHAKVQRLLGFEDD
jgi:hypothetical protein